MDLRHQPVDLRLREPVRKREQVARLLALVVAITPRLVRAPAEQDERIAIRTARHKISPSPESLFQLQHNKVLPMFWRVERFNKPKTHGQTTQLYRKFLYGRTCWWLIVQFPIIFRNSTSSSIFTPNS